ncbi:MAG: YHS domain-containing (seleno)protein [Myxococcota bacterium]
MTHRFALVAALTLAGCASGGSPSGPTSAPGSQAANVALDGYCPVAYIEAGKAVKGDPAHQTAHDGKTYYFASADAKGLYDADPGKYQVGYEGWCATAVAYNKKVPGDPTIFSVFEGETYLFANEGAKKTWDKNPAELKAKADSNWPSLSGYASR